jgi:hypothetical protein
MWMGPAAARARLTLTPPHRANTPASPPQASLWSAAATPTRRRTRTRRSSSRPPAAPSPWRRERRACPPAPGRAGGGRCAALAAPGRPHTSLPVCAPAWCSAPPPRAPPRLFHTSNARPSLLTAVLGPAPPLHPTRPRNAPLIDLAAAAPCGARRRRPPAPRRRPPWHSARAPAHCKAHTRHPSCGPCGVVGRHHDPWHVGSGGANRQGSGRQALRTTSSGSATQMQQPKATALGTPIALSPRAPRRRGPRRGLRPVAPRRSRRGGARRQGARRRWPRRRHARAAAGHPQRPWQRPHWPAARRSRGWDHSPAARRSQRGPSAATAPAPAGAHATAARPAQ